MLLVLFNSLIGSCQVLPRRARMDPRVVAMKGCSTFPKAPASLEPHHQIVLSHIPGHSLCGGITPLQRYSRCILEPQPTGQSPHKCYFHQLNPVDSDYRKKNP